MSEAETPVVLTARLKEAGEAQEPGRRPSFARVMAALVLPLFFVVFFPLAFVSALHDPQPHHLPLTLVGPEAVVGRIADSLSDGDAFDVTETDEVSQAKQDVRDRASVGSILVTAPSASSSGAPSSAGSEGTRLSVTAYTASAAGNGAAPVVTRLGQEVARQLNAPLKVEDIVPLAKRDPAGSNLFYLLTYSSIGAYLVIVALLQVVPRASLRVRYLTVTIASLVIPPVVFALSALFTGNYVGDVSHVFGLLGVDALYVFAIGSLAILAEQALGKAMMFGVMALVVFLNFPSSGGPVASSLLPPFWQGMHSVWYGSAAMEALRSVTYFDGAGAARWILQLVAWVLAIPLITALVDMVKANLKMRRTIAELGRRLEADVPADVARADALVDVDQHAQNGNTNTSASVR